MCGKFTQMASWTDVAAFSQPLVATVEGAPVTVARPMRPARIIRLGKDAKRELVDMRWGFSKPRKGNAKPDHIHARAETVDCRPRFCDAFGERRGVLLAETFNEGEELPDGQRKQWVIRPKDRIPMAIAVIWEEWGEGEPAFLPITVPANHLISRVTNRMLALLSQEDWPVWLGEADRPLREIKMLLGTFNEEGAWDMKEQTRPAKPQAEAPRQMDLF